MKAVMTGVGDNKMCKKIALLWLCFMIIAIVARAQTTDPAEVRVINSLFSQWGIPENMATDNGWNISGEPCSGTAVDNTTNLYDADINLGIKCDCSFPNFTCHISSLQVYSLDAAGPIPEGLWTLTYLTYLKLSKNYLTGSLSPSIGNLTQLQYVYFTYNALSGMLPPELGRLTDLRTLALGGNNFSGSLPSELGNLRRLEELYIDSSGLRGEIPSTFANLQNMQIIWASDNEFTGRIPDFIGNWSRLLELRFEGNAFEGSIPPTFSRLTSLTELRISGLSNVTLDFLADLKSLTVLILRNNQISGSMPTNIGEYQNLTHLDLSINRLTGQIPIELFNLRQISFLSLGNNSLNGTLPDVKSATLLNIDLSYNELSGMLPSWVNELNFQLNLVMNNFTLGGSENSELFSRLNCLQRNFPCNRGSPKYSSFGINCGGPKIELDSSPIMYESDNEVLRPATYYLSSKSRFGVSNVGQRDIPEFIDTTSPQFTETSYSVMFQSARLSNGSLRYYGFGLENGNYIVTLYFTELEIRNGPTWKSLGRRVFDIYLQGNLVSQDFDIKREAEGASNSPISRSSIVQVSNNYLEIHLFWSGRGTCCIPSRGTFGPLISAISATPNFNPTVSNTPPSKKKNRTSLITGIGISVAVVSLLLLSALYFYQQRRKSQYTFVSYEEFLGIDAKPYTFGYGDLRSATDDFSPANKLGEGGFGPVYKGTLKDGRVIAVKQLSGGSQQGKCQFVAEIQIIMAVQHRNLVKLYGCCVDREKLLLVYEYLENKSLDQALFGNNGLFLNWSTRFEICIGIAQGLTYLHEESNVRIVHRDVKAGNVLLDSDLNPKISDFGLAKLYDYKQTHMTTNVAGTYGYLAPEYAMRGRLTEKADVFSFGVVALEVVSGRTNASSLNEERVDLLEWAWNRYEAHREVELVDKKLAEFNEDEVKRVIKIALLCTQTAPMVRPSMSRVVAMLSGDIEAGGDVIRPGYFSGMGDNDTTSISSQGGAPLPSAGGTTVATTSTPATFSPLGGSPINTGIIEEGG